VTSLTRWLLSACRGTVGGMHVNLPGQAHYRPTSLVSPLLQLVLAAIVLLLSVWSYLHAPTVRATDQWAYNFLAAVAGCRLPWRLSSAPCAIAGSADRPG
jgi:hypothetical protein